MNKKSNKFKVTYKVIFKLSLIAHSPTLLHAPITSYISIPRTNPYYITDANLSE